MTQRYADIIIDISHEKVDRTFQYRIPEELAEKVTLGSLVMVPFGKGNRLRTGYIIGFSDGPKTDPSRIKSIREIPERSLPVEGKLVRLAAWIHQQYGGTMIQALKTVTPVREKVREKAVTTDLMEEVPDLTPVKQLNFCQQKVLSRFTQDYQKGIRKTYLLHGVTGSGKTEVYLGMAEEVLKEGKDVIVLVPEISLTFQTVARFQNRFRNQISILNSRLSKGEKYREFQKAAKGETRIMIGPRSGLFAPFRNLGLIIIDEEHDSAYKSETTPKYHARETAIQRASLEGASVVLGSATPSVISYSKARSGAYQLLTLDQRAEGQPLPEVSIVDMRKEMKNGNRGILSGELYRNVAEALERKEQTMLFLNRRGYHSYVSCRSCGTVLKCPHCDVSLSLHGNGRLVCHYCGYSMAMPRTCPVCGSGMIGGFGIGTERVEAEVRKLFPEARVLRMDRDTTTRKGSQGKIISAFRNHEADILIGTQMIVKGHDFGNVTVVGAVLADLGLFDGNFESSERTFDLLTQAAGRAGRGKLPGHVVIQTYQPDHYAIQAAAKQDYTAFYEMEISYRKLLRYPPACHMLGILIQADQEEDAVGAVEELAAYLREKFSDCDIIGPTDAAIGKIRDQYRKVLYLKSESGQRLRQAAEISEIGLREAVQKGRIEISVDFDPVNME